MRHNSCNITIYTLTLGLNLLSSPPTCSLEWSLSLWPVPWPPIFLSCVQPGMIPILWRGPRPPILPSYVEPGMIPILRSPLGCSSLCVCSFSRFQLLPTCSLSKFLLPGPLRFVLLNNREKKRKKKKEKEEEKKKNFKTYTLITLLFLKKINTP